MLSLARTSQVFGGQDSDAVMLRAVTDDGAAVAVKVSRDLGISGLLASAALAGPIPSGIPAPLRSRSGKPYSILTGALIRDWCAAGDALAMILAQIEALGDELRAGSTASVVCHGDAHIANVLLSDDGNGVDGGVWLLDWDEVVRAPRERDLMFVIGGVLADAPVTKEQQGWFFDGYGRADIDPIHLAYYRCSWALQDVADYAARILDQSARSSPAGQQALELFRDAVSPTGIVNLAHRSLQRIGRAVRS